jgi:hypothetical protein
MFIGLFNRFLKKTTVLAVGVSILLTMGLAVDVNAANFSITEAKWDARKNRLEVKGRGERDLLVTVTNADTGAFVGDDTVDRKSKWRVKVNYNNPASVPCRVRAEQSDGSFAERNVRRAPADCDDGGGVVNTPPTANDDAYNATSGVELSVAAPGVLGNDTDDGLLNPLTATLDTDVANGALVLNADGSFTYTSNSTFEGDDTFTYSANDGEFTATATVTITVTAVVADPQCSDGIDNDGDGLIDFPADPGCTDANDNNEADPIDPGFANQTDFKIMMNYELGMHCTGFEFAYCCVLPAYNSILAQVVKPSGVQGFPELLSGDPNAGLDALGRQTVVRDVSQSGNGFDKYVLKYWHEAQPRNDGRGKPQSSLLISAVEGNSLMSWNTTFDSAATTAGNALVYDAYNGSDGVVQGDGDFTDASDNYQNAIWNHLYFYDNLEGGNAAGSSLEADKVRLGVTGNVVYPTDCGPALHPMGPVTQNGDPTAPEVANDCAGFSNGNVLTFSGEHGTVVYTQMKVLENLPIMLTSPDIWEALGLPLTPFEDSVDFFGDPGLLNEDSVRPYVAMKAQMHDYDPAAPGGAGAATLDSNGDPVIGFGTAPIDIPNCERCHSNPANGETIQNAANEGGGELTVINSPNDDPDQYAKVQQEYNYWNAYYNIDTAAGDSDWYSRLKSAAISMLNGHDIEHGTSFVANYPGTEVAGVAPQNTRLGHESVICQRCHADNVIAAVKSATYNGETIKPISEAIHNNHRGVNMADASGVGGDITFADSLGRDGGCQGCHPAHRSNGDMDGYPITLAGGNRYADGDNRGANGGCFVGRDVHSNPGKDSDGVETPAHMNAVGQHLVDTVASDGMGIWCTNCHNQFGQEIWKAENMVSLVHGVPGKEADLVTDAVNIRALPTVAAIAAAVGTTEAQALSWLDPTEGMNVGDDDSYAIWASLPKPDLCAFLVDPTNPAHDANVATIEVAIPAAGHACSTPDQLGPVDCSSVGGPIYNICGTNDADGDFSVNALDFCTTPDCVAVAQASLTNSAAVPVPMSAATDGRDHWLSPGEPHCADCHAAPFTEQSGNINAYTPFNYPRKASLMRYSKGHQNISCQGCHESIHGLYPVTPNIDTTSYAQAKALNHDGTAGPLKCGTCHDVDGQGIPTFMDTGGNNVYGITDYDSAVAWAHEYTEEQSVLDTTCQNCHGPQGGANWSDVNIDNEEYMEHASRNNPRGSRNMMDKAEMELNGGSVFMNAGSNQAQNNGNGGLCLACHGAEGSNVSCNDSEWLDHLTEGRVSAPVFEMVSEFRTGGTCW